MTRICVDTSAYSHFKRGSEEAIQVITTAKVVSVPVIVIGELRTGFAMGRRPEENERELQAFLSHPAVDVLDVDEEAAGLYAELVVALRQAGTPIPTNDIWIAALAIREGATLVTYDQHFAKVQRLGKRLLTPCRTEDFPV